MPKGSCGSSVTICDDGGNADNAKKRTWVIVASGLERDSIAADIEEIAAKQHHGKWSEVPPKVETRFENGRLYAFGEGGDLQLLVSAMGDALWDLTTSDNAHAA
jgi:hypothetical protein